MAQKIKGMCNYCGTGCSLTYIVEDDGMVSKVEATADYPVNMGKACSKGFRIMDPINAPDRGAVPLLRDRNGNEKVISWDNASEIFASRIKDIQNKYGRKSVAFISTGQLFTEEFALLGMLRGIMGIEGDGNTRQCMASAVVGFKQAFGFDAPSMTYKDIEESDCIIFIGSNAAIAHPIIFDRIKNNPHNPKVIVIDPRKTETVKKDSLHIAVKPKRDLYLLYVLANELIKRNRAIKHDFISQNTNNFEEFKNFVSKFNTDNFEEITEVPLNTFYELVESIENAKGVTFWWAMGVNQSHQGVETSQAIINICLMTGNIGRVGAGPCSLTGQTNAMGSRLFSNTTALFGGRDYANADHRKQICDILNITDDIIPSGPTKPYNAIIDGIENGTIKAIWVICTNPLHSWINADRINKLFNNLEFLVVQDLFPNTATSKKADLYLPAMGIGEKNGILINSERRIGYSPVVKKTLKGEPLSDFDIFLKLGRAYGDKGVLDAWNTHEKVFELLKRFSKDMPCDITGIKDYQHLLDAKGIQWPFPKGSDIIGSDGIPKENERRLFEDNKFFTADKKAKFVFKEFIEPAVEPDAEYPFYLLSGRGNVGQFQTDTRTGRSAVITKKYPGDKPYVEINEQDAQELGISEGDKLRISSKKAGVFEAFAKVGNIVKSKYIFIPMHFIGANSLIPEAFDPQSFEPSFKTGALKIEKINQ